MAENDKSKSSTEERKGTSDVADDSMPLEQLIDEAGVRFGQPGLVVAGALAEGNKKNFSHDEAAEAIKTWLKRPVQTD